MSSSIPPYPYFNGIEYNSAFFTSADSGLTIGQANSKYLQKTVTDTATALETFTAGIKTDAINPTTTTGTIQIGQAATNSNVEIASQTSRSTVLHLGDGNSSSGAIHIGNGSASNNNINILNGNYSALQTAGTVNILTGTHNVNSFGGNMNICTGSRGTLTIGSSLLNQILFNKQPQFNTGIISDTIDGVAITSSPNLFNNITTGNMQYGQGQTTGTLSIGGGSNRNGTIFIGTITKGNISIGNNMTAGTNTISIGTSSLGSAALKGATVKINDLGTGTTEIGNASSGAITFYQPITPSYTISATTGAGVGKVGEFKKVSNGFGYALVAAAATSILNLDLTAGVWLLTGGMTTGSVGAGYNIITFSLVNNALNLGLGAMNIPAFGGFTYNLCICNTFCFTATTRVYLVAQVGSNDTWATPSITATRLA